MVYDKEMTMPRDKDLKRLVRTRMKKTGEAYTTARAHILNKPRAKKPASASPRAPAPAVVKPEEYAVLAGKSDETMKKNTGRNWEEWLRLLDDEGAKNMTHTAVAALINEKYQVDGWWAQTVTVGYERLKGIRARGQRLDGTYEANKSRTFSVPVSTLFDAWADEKKRKRWLSETGVKVRTANAPKSLRLGWSDGAIVAVGFTAKGSSKSSVAIQHTKLRDKESASRMTQYWTERLDALAQLLS